MSHPAPALPFPNPRSPLTTALDGPGAQNRPRLPAREPENYIPAASPAIRRSPEMLRWPRIWKRNHKSGKLCTLTNRCDHRFCRCVCRRSQVSSWSEKAVSQPPPSKSKSRIPNSNSPGTTMPSRCEGLQQLKILPQLTWLSVSAKVTDRGIVELQAVYDGCRCACKVEFPDGAAGNLGN